MVAKGLHLAFSCIVGVQGGCFNCHGTVVFFATIGILGGLPWMWCLLTMSHVRKASLKMVIYVVP